MDFSLSEEHQMIQQAARDFAQNELLPGVIERDDEQRFPAEQIKKLGELGFLGMMVDPKYNGSGMDTMSYVIAMEELSKVDASASVVVSVNNSLVCYGLETYGTEEQKQKYLPRYASGEIIGSFCLTEPEAGSDAASLKTSAVKDGDFYVLNGTKRFITNAPHAATFTVMARTNPDIKGASGISAFLVEANTPGISLGKIDQKMGQKGSHTCDVIFENCRVPASALIGGIEGIGFKTAMKVLDKGRLHIGAYSVGVAERMLNDALHYAIERKQFGQPIANFQLIQAMLADSKAEIYAAKCMVLDAARRRDNGENISTEASCSKMFATEMCGRVADRCVQIHGGAGYISEYAIERFYRDVRLFRLYEGTTQVQQLIIAKNMIRDATA